MDVTYMTVGRLREILAGFHADEFVRVGCEVTSDNTHLIIDNFPYALDGREATRTLVLQVYGYPTGAC